MKIVNSHLVPLQPPYPIIYSKGELAMQTATLIVVEGADALTINVDKSPSQNKITTHSYPVVSYFNKFDADLSPFPEPNDCSEGIVWDNVELSKVTVLCYTNKPEIQSARLDTIISIERYNNAFHNNHTFQLNKLLQRLRRFNIHFSIADMFKGVSLEPKVKVTFIKQTPNNIFLFGLKDGFAPYLEILLRWSDNIDEMEKTLRFQIDDYRAAIAPHILHFSFDSRIEEWEPLAERLNKIYSRL